MAGVRNIDLNDPVMLEVIRLENNAVNKDRVKHVTTMANHGAKKDNEIFFGLDNR